MSAESPPAFLWKNEEIFKPHPMIQRFLDHVEAMKRGDAANGPYAYLYDGMDVLIARSFPAEQHKTLLRFLGIPREWKYYADGRFEKEPVTSIVISTIIPERNDEEASLFPEKEGVPRILRHRSNLHLNTMKDHIMFVNGKDESDEVKTKAAELLRDIWGIQVIRARTSPAKEAIDPTYASAIERLCAEIETRYPEAVRAAPAWLEDARFQEDAKTKRFKEALDEKRTAFLAQYAAELSDPEVLIPRFAGMDSYRYQEYVKIPNYDVFFKTKEGHLGRIRKGGLERPLGSVTFLAPLLEGWKLPEENDSSLPASLGGLTMQYAADEREVTEYEKLVGESSGRPLFTFGFDTTHPTFPGGTCVFERVTWTDMRERVAALSEWIAKTKFL